MEFIEKSIIASLIAINILLLIIKFTLQARGDKINWLFEWGKDYSKFNEMRKNEINEKRRKTYDVIVYSLWLAFVWLVLSGLAGILI